MVGFERKKNEHEDFYSIKNVSFNSNSRRDDPKCLLSEPRTPNKCSSYLEVKFRPKQDVQHTERQYLTMFKVLEELGGLATVVIAILAVLNIYFSTWSYNFEMMRKVVGSEELKRHNFYGIKSLVFYKVLCCCFCSKKARKRRRAALLYYDRTTEILADFLEVQNLIISQIMT